MNIIKRREISIGKHDLKKIIKERWKYYLLGYMFGYFFPLLMDGIPNNLYLIPIKLTGILFALSLGTALYYGDLQLPIYSIAFRAVKYAIIIMILIYFGVFLKYFIYSTYGIDISPIIGF